MLKKLMGLGLATTFIITGIGTGHAATPVASTQQIQQTMTQGEFVVGLVKALKYAPKSEWDAYMYMKEKGLNHVAGWKYEPTKQLTRHDVMRLSLKALSPWYEVTSAGMTDEKLITLLEVVKNYPDRKFHGEDLITRADAQYALKEIGEWKDAKDRGKVLFDNFQKSLKVKDGILTGTVPKAASDDLLIRATAVFKNGERKFFTGTQFSLQISELRALSFLAYDRKTGHDMADFLYRSLPTLTPVEGKVLK